MYRECALSLVLVVAAPAWAQRAKHGSRGSTPSRAPAAGAATRTTLPPPPSQNTIQPFDDSLQGKPPHAEGDYGGVIPGQTRKTDPPGKPIKAPPKGTLAWIGFEAKTGGTEVFFQSAAAFELAQHVDNGTLVVNLSGITRLGQNAWRPIDTRFFDTPVAKIAARQVGAGKGRPAGIEVRVTFKNAKDAKEAASRAATEADGLYYAYLTFDGGAAAAGADPSVSEPEK